MNNTNNTANAVSNINGTINTDANLAEFMGTVVSLLGTIIENQEKLCVYSKPMLGKKDIALLTTFSEKTVDEIMHDTEGKDGIQVNRLGKSRLIMRKDLIEYLRKHPNRECSKYWNKVDKFNKIKRNSKENN